MHLHPDVATFRSGQHQPTARHSAPTSHHRNPLERRMQNRKSSILPSYAIPLAEQLSSSLGLASLIRPTESQSSLGVCTTYTPRVHEVHGQPKARRTRYQLQSAQKAKKESGQNCPKGLGVVGLRALTIARSAFNVVVFFSSPLTPSLVIFYYYTSCVLRQVIVANAATAMPCQLPNLHPPVGTRFSMGFVGADMCSVRASAGFAPKISAVPRGWVFCATRTVGRSDLNNTSPPLGSRTIALGSTLNPGLFSWGSDHGVALGYLMLCILMQYVSCILAGYDLIMWSWISISGD